MIIGGEFHDIIENIFEDVKNIHNSEQISVNCPRCQEEEYLAEPDGKYNLEINTQKRVFRCWKCENPKFSGTLKKLIRIYGTDADYKIFKSLGGDLFDYNFDDEEIEAKEVHLPTNMICFSQMNSNNPDHFEAYNYLVNERKLSREIILKFRLGFCVTGKYRKRIIIPSYDENGGVNYFVARSYIGKKPPYMNPDLNKESIIFNEGMINWDSTLYMCEGVFEMLSFPVNMHLLLGKNISSKMIKKIGEFKPNIVILLDPDAYASAIELLYILHAIYTDCEEKIKIIKLPGKKDLDEIRREYGREKIIEHLYQARGLTIDDYFEKKLRKPNGFYKKRGRADHKRYFVGG